MADMACGTNNRIGIREGGAEQLGTTAGLDAEPSFDRAR